MFYLVYKLLPTDTPSPLADFTRWVYRCKLALISKNIKKNTPGRPGGLIRDFSETSVLASVTLKIISRITIIYTLRMSIIINLLYFIGSQMRINLSSAQRPMPKQLLNHAEISTIV